MNTQKLARVVRAYRAGGKLWITDLIDSVLGDDSLTAIQRSAVEAASDDANSYEVALTL